MPYALVAAVTIALCQAVATTDGDATIETRRIVITDDKGTPVIELSADEHGGTIVIRSAAGKDVVTLGDNGRGGYAKLFQNDGRPAVSLHTYPVSRRKTAGMIENFDDAGKAAVSIGIGDLHGGPVSMGAHVRGGVVVIDRPDGLHRLDGPMLAELRKLVEPPKSRRQRE